jgi:C4-dicarboxylate transporter
VQIKITIFPVSVNSGLVKTNAAPIVAQTGTSHGRFKSTGFLIIIFSAFYIAIAHEYQSS